MERSLIRYAYETGNSIVLGLGEVRAGSTQPCGECGVAAAAEQAEAQEYDMGYHPDTSVSDERDCESAVRRFGFTPETFNAAVEASIGGRWIADHALYVDSPDLELS